MSAKRNDRQVIMRREDELRALLRPGIPAFSATAARIAALFGGISRTHATTVFAVYPGMPANTSCHRLPVRQNPKLYQAELEQFSRSRRHVAAPGIEDEFLQIRAIACITDPHPLIQRIVGVGRRGSVVRNSQRDDISSNGAVFSEKRCTLPQIGSIPMESETMRAP